MVHRERRGYSGTNQVAIFYYMLFFVALLYPLPAYAASSIDITVKQRILTAQKSGIVTLPFTVTNRSNKTLNLIEHINLPEGWRLLASSGSFTLTSGERTVRLIHVLASSEVAAGSYTLPYSVVSQNQLSIHAEENISVIVTSHSQLSVDIIEPPRLVLAGEEYKIKVRITNRGNATVSFNAHIKDRLGYITSLKPKFITLQPSESSTLMIKANIPPSLKNTSYHSFKLLLNGKTVQIEKDIKTRIVSRTPEGPGQYHTLPVTISGHYTSNSNTGGTLQTQLSAAGSLDEDGNHNIDLLFFFRNKQTQSTSSLGLDSEMRVSYLNPEFGLHLGDRLFPIAGITDNGFYGKGLELEYHLAGQPWFLRAFSARHNESNNDNDDNDDNPTDDAIDDKSEDTLKGLEIGYQFEEGLTVIANMLLKKESSITATSSQQTEALAGFDIQWDKHDAFEVGLSYAKDKDGHAFRFEQNGLVNSLNTNLNNNLNYNLTIQHADALFDGQIKDIKSQSATGIYTFNQNKSYLRGNLFHSQRNLAHDITKEIRDEKVARLGIGHYFNERRRDSLFTEAFVRIEKDKREQSTLDHSDKGLRLEYQKNINHSWALNTSIEFAHETNRIKKQASHVNRQSLTLAYTPNDKYHLGANIDNAKSIDNKGNSLSYGLNAAIHFSQLHHLSGYWRHSDQSSTQNDRFQLNYQYQFSNGLSLGLSASTDTQQSKDNDIDYLIRVSMPLDIPLYKRKDISSMKGQIIDSEDHQPVVNSIINIAGQYAISDEQGYYEFKSLLAGEYAIATDLSRSTLNLNHRIEEGHEKIVIPANQTVLHNIVLTPGTSLIGQVRKYITSKSSILQNENEDLIPSDGIAGLLVSLQSTSSQSTKYNEIVHKSLTTEGGFFSFNGIKAGRWQIQITDPKRLITESRLNNPQRIVELKAGEELELEFKAVPLLKKIKKIGPSSGFSVSGE